MGDDLILKTSRRCYLPPPGSLCIFPMTFTQETQSYLLPAIHCLPVDWKREGDCCCWKARGSPAAAQAAAVGISDTVFHHRRESCWPGTALTLALEGGDKRTKRLVPPALQHMQIMRAATCNMLRKLRSGLRVWWRKAARFTCLKSSANRAARLWIHTSITTGQKENSKTNQARHSHPPQTCQSYFASSAAYLNNSNNSNNWKCLFLAGGQSLGPYLLWRLLGLLVTRPK